MAIVSRTTVKQVLDDIQVRLPHEYSDESLFLWINETMKKIYKDLAIQDRYSFLTRANKELYVLPENCSIDMIDYVTISTKARSQENPYEWGNFEELKSYLPNEKMTVKGYYDGREGTIRYISCTSRYKKNRYILFKKAFNGNKKRQLYRIR